MNWPSGGLYPSAPRSSSDDMDRTYPTYTNPLLVTSSPSQSLNPGLGISYGEIEPSFSYPRQCPPFEQYTADWEAQLIPSGLPSLDTSHISPATLYERYPGSDASASPLSHCGPHAMSATPSRGSALDYRAPRETQAFNIWPNTPRSDADIMIKEEIDAEMQETPYMEYAKPVSVPLFAPVAQYTANGIWPKLEYPEEDHSTDLTIVDHDYDSRLSVESSAFAEESGLPGTSENSMLPDHRQLRIPPASGQQCTICGLRFTRKSNCKEHMRRHDPSNRKTYTCPDCGKSLGRKTDLKRHVDSVHRGIRKFGCDHCGGRFSRQDTLARHKSDGCRRGRRSSASRRADSRPPSQPRLISKGC